MKKSLLIFILFFLSISLSFSQAKSDSIPTRSEAKFINNPIDGQATFLKLFEVWNVGNLHLYSQKQNTKNVDYYYSGKKINYEFKNFLSADLRVATLQTGKEPYAIAAVRGEKLTNYYLLRINHERSANTLALFEMENGQLKKKKVLAYYRKQGNNYEQLDSWLQDLNGDTRLDLIQKKQLIDKNGAVKKIKTKVFLRNRKGKFRQTSKIKVSKVDYQMQDL